MKVWTFHDLVFVDHNSCLLTMISIEITGCLSTGCVKLAKMSTMLREKQSDAVGFPSMCQL